MKALIAAWPQIAVLMIFAAELAIPVLGRPPRGRAYDLGVSVAAVLLMFCLLAAGGFWHPLFW